MMPHLIKIKNVWSAKDTVKRMKRQATDWEKMVAKHIICYKGLAFKIYKLILKLNNKENKQLIYKKAKDVNRHSQKKITDGK